MSDASQRQMHVVSDSRGALMSAVFYGDSFHSVDAKNRVHVPKRFQEALARDGEGSLACYLSLGVDGCLYLFSEEGFRQAMERLETQAITGPEQRRLQRLFFANTRRVQLDAAGRLLVPEKLRAAVGIEREVAMVGVAHRAEIWPREAWESFESSNAEDGLDDLHTILCSPPGSEGDASAS